MLMFLPQVDIFSSGLTEDILAVIEASGEPRVTSMVPGEEYVTDRPTRFPKQERTAYELWQIHKRKTDLRQEYLEYWEASVRMTGTGRPVDAIISPVAPFAAPPHGQNRYGRSSMLMDT
jgi:amidase